MALLYFDEFCKKTKLPSATRARIADSYRFTSEKISLAKKLLQKELTGISSKNKYCIVAVGSYGRYEASRESDAGWLCNLREKSSSKDPGSNRQQNQKSC